MNPYEDHSFDVVLCMGAFYHLEEKARNMALEQCLRLLKKNGVLVISYINFMAALQLNLNAKLENMGDVSKFYSTSGDALLFYADGEKRYIIAPNGLQVGATLMSGETAAPEIGNALPLQNIPVGTVIHNIELRPGQGAALVRSAGNFAQLTSREGKYCVIKLPSGEVRQILSTCKATIGSVGNSDHGLESSGKAGRSRWQGRRPRNRGVVMNPVDHPMGGGEGRASGGHPRSRKGLYAKGLKTRAPKKQSSKYIIERRKK